MKRFKKVVVAVAMIMALSTASITVFAVAYDTPADVAADLTGKTVEEVVNERIQTGKTYGQMAKEAGKLEEFKEQALEMKKSILEERVAEGLLTQEEADEIVKAIEENQAFCNGAGLGSGAKMGAGFGRANEAGNGYGRTNGNGRGLGRGFCR